MKKNTLICAMSSIVGQSIFAAILLFEHFLRPELSPLSHFLSEYSLGPLGWIHITAFAILAISQLFLFTGLITNVNSSLLSLMLFSIYCVGLLLVTVFPTDVPGSKPTTSGLIHGFAALGAFSSFMLSLFAWAFDFKKHRRWQKMAQWSFILGTLSCLIFIAHLLSPSSIVGLFQRILMVCNLVWLSLVSERLYKIAR